MVSTQDANVLVLISSIKVSKRLQQKIIENFSFQLGTQMHIFTRLQQQPPISLMQTLHIAQCLSKSVL